MRKGILSIALLSVVAAATIYGCLVLQGEYHLFKWGMGPVFLLFWPSILLSRSGLHPSWIVPAAAMTVACVWLGWIVRRRWLAPVPIGLALGLAYCFSGAIAFRCLSIPLPAVTPYDNDTAKRGTYMAAYGEGYRYGISGVFRTYCFAPEPETRGFYEGMMEGLKIPNRVLGKADLSQRTKNVARAWAGSDGVDLDTSKTNVEPTDAAAASLGR